MNFDTLQSHANPIPDPGRVKMIVFGPYIMLLHKQSWDLHSSLVAHAQYNTDTTCAETTSQDKACNAQTCCF